MKFLLEKEKTFIMFSSHKQNKGFSMSNDSIFILDNQARSKGGTVAAQNMTPQQRKERAIKANSQKKCNKGIPRATHTGEMKIGDISVSCAVLEDGTRVISESSVFAILGKSRGGRGKIKNLELIDGDHLPAFLSNSNLIPFIPKHLIAAREKIVFIHPKSGKTYGHKAESIPDICKVFIDAKNAGVLKASQIPFANQCLVIIQALAKTGITALVDECTFYQRDRDMNELQKLFKMFIAKEIQPWVKRFPPEFFDNLKKMYGLEHLKGNPKFAGHLINKYIYNELSPEIHEELKRRNPINEKGYRSTRHHQLLTHNIGCPALEKQIIKVNTLMSVSDNKDQFIALYEKTRDSKE